MSSPLRVLVVDDFGPWRNFVSSFIETVEGYEVIGVVGDGLEAVHSATIQQPDIVVLDISIPQQNGLEAARCIRMLVPNAKIIFLSDFANPEIVRTALEIGASGYVVKADALMDLTAALDAVRNGKKYISPRLSI